MYSSFVFDRHTIDVSHLPIMSVRESVLSAIDKNSVTIIHGSTGCGKSTQVPQFILDDCVKKRIPCNIIITQPRRIAATSLAERVSNERDWTPGTLVGYQVGLKRDFQECTKILYVTVGVLLEKLIHARSLSQWTHIILDEVHERSQEMDMCLLIVKQLLLEHRPSVRIVLMSASAETARLREYYSTFEPFIDANPDPYCDSDMAQGDHDVVRRNKPPVISVDGRLFHVDVFYLEEIEKIFKEEKIDIDICPDIDDVEDRMSMEAKRRILKELLCYFDTLDKRTAEEKGNVTTFERGSVLVFLPGLGHITDVRDFLIGYRADDTIIEGAGGDHGRNWSIIPLHSTISQADQQRVFKPSSAGHRKIILSTNIAESSITVPDVRYVVDFCLTKRLRRDTNSSHFSCLKLESTSKSSCEQRKGRAGRLAAGRCYRLVRRSTYDLLAEHCPAEIQIAPLEHVILRVKLLDGDPLTMLNEALDKPNVEDVGLAILTLKEVGALTVMRKRASYSDKCEPEEFGEREETYGGCMVQNFDHMDGDLTFVGRLMSRLPVDVHIGKLIALGYVFGVLKEAIIVGAAISTSRSIFKQPFQGEKPDQALRAYGRRLGFAAASYSDCFAVRNAYLKYELFLATEYRGRSNEKESFCNSRFLDRLALADTSALIEEITHRLEDLNIRLPPRDYPNLQEKDDPRLKDFMLQLAIAGAFYPNYFIRKHNRSVEATARKAFGNRDPMYCAELGHLPMNKGLLYKTQLETMFTNYCLDKDQRSYCKVRVDFHDTKGVVDFSDIKRYEESITEVGEDDYERRPSSSRPATTPLTKLVVQPVFLALKMKQIPRLRPYVVKVNETLNVQKALEDIQKQSLMKYRTTNGSPAGQRLSYENHIGYPGLETAEIKLQVTFVKNCCHFFGIYKENVKDLQKIEKIIYEYIYSNDIKELVVGKVVPNMICLAPRQVRHRRENIEISGFARVRVRQFHQHEKSSDRWLVNYLDYGGSRSVHAKDLLVLPDAFRTDKYPHLALECHIAEVQPHSVFRPNGDFLPDDKKTFEKKMFQLNSVKLKIYSLIGSTLRVHLEHSLDFLSPYAIEFKEEGFASQADHLERLKAQRLAEMEKTTMYPYANSDCQSMKDKNDLATIQRFQLERFADEEEALLRRLSKCVIDSGTIARSKINIQGPDHPYELRFFGMTSYSSERKVVVAQESINSVILDDHPQSHLDRLMVAGLVQSSSRDHSNLILRHTTMMPYLPGLPALMALVFAPVAELRVSRCRTRYTGAICGLGYDENGHPLHPNNDLEVTFDTHFDNRTLLSVNEIRLGIDMILSDNQWQDTTIGSHLSVIQRLQDRVKNAVQHLFLPKASPHLVNRVDCPNPFCWRMLPASAFINNGKRIDAAVGSRHVLYQCHYSVQGVDSGDMTDYLHSLYSGISTQKESPADIARLEEFEKRWRTEMKERLDEIYLCVIRLVGPKGRQIVASDELEKTFVCELCLSRPGSTTFGFICSTVQSTVEHLKSEAHRRCEEAIRYQRNPMAEEMLFSCS